jgi:Uma2 family endonuclease
LNEFEKKLVEDYNLIDAFRHNEFVGIAMSTSIRITTSEYDRMIETGAFSPAEEHHVELIRGEVHAMSPINPPHEGALDHLMYWSIDHAPRNLVRIRPQFTLGIPLLESVPQPDLTWVRHADYSKRRPTAADVMLLVEVADSSLHYDRGEKADLYAEAGILDYWIVNVIAKTIEIRRKPVAGHYQQVEIAGIGDCVDPLAFPELELRVADLFVHH